MLPFDGQSAPSPQDALDPPAHLKRRFPNPTLILIENVHDIDYKDFNNSDEFIDFNGNKAKLRRNRWKLR